MSQFCTVLRTCKVLLLVHCAADTQRKPLQPIHQSCVSESTEAEPFHARHFPLFLLFCRYSAPVKSYQHCMPV